VPGEAPDRPLRITEGGDAYFGRWAETASDEDFEAVAEVLLAVTDGTVFGTFRHWADTTRALQVHVEARLFGPVVTLRFFQEYPDRFTIVRIGKLP
jgi:hypothetical protein